MGLVVVAQAYKPNYLGSRDRENHSLRPACTWKGSQDTIPPFQPMAEHGGMHLFP
jgi:hypothetical protein